jgi:acyl-CoA synthetase (AMP-forming)/AMP-acid ligase II
MGLSGRHLSEVAAPTFGWLEGVETLSEIAQVRSEQAASQAGFRFLFVNKDELPPGFTQPAGEDSSVAVGYRDAFEIARRAAFHLASRGVGRGDKVLIVMPTGPGFLAAFLGCQLLGAVPVPAVPPFSLRTIDEYVGRIVRLATNAQIRAVVTIDKLVPVFRVARGSGAEAKKCFSRVVLSRELLAEDEALDSTAPPDPDAPALIQYTSGSTGTPKGVVLSHRTLLANVRAIGKGAQFHEGDVALAWLPLFHDMGLIGHFIAAHVWGMPLVLLPPEVFVKRPKEWLKAITRYKGTCSASPNFGYALCCRKVKEDELASFDLSSWRVAFCGAEPIAPDTVRSFTEKFAKSGFAPGAFFPVYGMAELSLAATFPPPGRPPVYDRIERDAFERTGKALPASAELTSEQTMTWVSVGSAVPGHEIRIVGKDGLPLPERTEGEIQVRGPSLMVGYYENPVATAEAIQQGWLRTGDLGYIASGELYVTGRSKEMIIKGGRNLYPQDIERAASTVEGIRAGCCAAFGVRNDARGTEDLILVAELKVATTDEAARESLASSVKRAVFDATGASPDLVVLVSPGSVPKTSSGKIQRDLARKRYLKNDLERGGTSLATLARLKIAQVVENLKGFVFGRT